MKKILVMLIMLPWAGVALAHGGITVHDAWIRTVSSHVPAAGYFVVDNNGHEPVELVGAETPAYGHAMIHRTMEHDGQSQMMHVEAIKVPAGGKATFAPGGYHLMLMHAKKTLEPGDTVSVTLIFSNGHRITTPFEVRSAIGQ